MNDRELAVRLLREELQTFVPAFERVSAQGSEDNPWLVKLARRCLGHPAVLAIRNRLETMADDEVLPAARVMRAAAEDIAKSEGVVGQAELDLAKNAEQRLSGDAVRIQRYIEKLLTDG